MVGALAFLPTPAAVDAAWERADHAPALTEADRLAKLADVPHELAELVVMAATREDVPVRWLRSPSTDKRLMRARWWVVARARSAPPADGAHPNRGARFSFWEIARALNRDHATIIYAAKRAREKGIS